MHSFRGMLMTRRYDTHDDSGSNLSAASRTTRMAQGLVLFTGAACGAALMMLIMGQAPGEAAPRAERVVVAERFVLVDDQGRRRAVVGVSTEGPGFYLLDETERPRVGLDMARGRPSLVFSDEHGRSHVRLAMTAEGSALSLADADGRPRIGLDVSSGRPDIHLLDEHGTLQARLGVTADGTGLYLADERGKTRATLNLGRDGVGLSLLDRDGTRRAALGRAETERQRDGVGERRPESSLLLFDAEGKVVWEAP